MLGRYSKRPEFKRRGRSIYSDKEGCIADAWNKGSALIENLPCPETAEQAYLDQHKNVWKIDKGIAKKFSMKSRSYFAVAIEDDGGNRIAVIVFESIIPSGALDDGLILSELNSYEGKRIKRFLERMRNLEPSPTYAQQEGY